ncbi:CHAD domain-containing protein [Skermanella mucosa]|uniref:CHAD domain-containing protein n=1 Tax=Skermanella mucosa TaxID=1789672 RepID=UPI00192AA472|nr:CHAD domain-containing protein [Skermanella mucosa]UEM22754.1 CHAD domain-containing protein [Skermanella mucosa]
MAYCFTPEETVPEGVRRIALEQIDKAEAALTGGKERHKAVHNARKGCKKIRALLRLARGGLGNAYARENACFRDAQRRLSAVRDASVMVEALDKLAGRQGSDGAGGFAPVRNVLVERCERASAEHLEQERTTEEVAAMLREARGRVETWTLRSPGFKVLRPGLHKVYRDGAKRFATLGEAPTAHDFHDWRKQAKYLSYDLKLLTPVWPGTVGALAGEFGELGSLLGDEHDLAVLRCMLEADEQAFGGPTLVRPLAGMIEQRRSELQAASRMLGARLYLDRPKAFMGRMEAWWDMWKAEPASRAA